MVGGPAMVGRPGRQQKMALLLGILLDLLLDLLLEPRVFEPRLPVL